MSHKEEKISKNWLDYATKTFSLAGVFDLVTWCGIKYLQQQDIF